MNEEDFKFIRHIGKGGFGNVYMAEAIYTHELVAIK